MTRDQLIGTVRAYVRAYIALFAGAAALVVLALAVILPGVFADSTAFFGRYHGYTQNFNAVKTSSHKGIACEKCHVDKRGPIVHDVAFAADFYLSLVSKRDTPMFLKFDKPQRAACVACHEYEWSDDANRTGKVPHPAHLRVAEETRECVNCHKWTAHDESYMQKHKQMPFSGVCVAYGCHVGTKQTKECGNCHHSLDTAGVWKTDHPKVVQVAGANGCLETCHEATQCRQCHTTGTTPKINGVIAVQSGLQEIQTMHVKPDWISQHGGEALKQGQTACMKCHVSDGECKACHAHRPAFHGTDNTAWIGQHKNFAKGHEDRCYECHPKSLCDNCHQQFKEMR